MRFSVTVHDLAHQCDGRIAEGGPSTEVLVCGLSTLDQATADDVSFLAKAAYATRMATTKAGCVLVSEALYTPTLAETVPPGTAVVLVPDAYRTFVQLMHRVAVGRPLPDGMRSPTATIDASAEVAASAAIGPGCVIGAGCVIDDGVQLVANVVVSPNVHIGAQTIIHGNVSIGHNCQIGQHCVIHAGVVIGADGFGYFEHSDGSYEKVPQVGNVVMGDHVEVGANTCIDRAAVGSTVIGNGVKLDNLVHIAHGVHVGEHTAIAAQAGISGSATIGARNRIAGQVGIVGHIATADNVTVMAQSGVAKAINQPGVYFGSPAKDHRTALRIEGVLRRLPELAADVEELKRSQHSHNDTSKTS